MRAAICKLITLFLLSTGFAHSAEWKIDPTLRFQAGYDDNLRMNSSDVISSAEATFSPSAIFSVMTPASGVSGKVGFDFRRFESDSNLNEDNSRFEINSFHSLEQSRLGLDLGFIKDTTLGNQPEATGLAFDRIRRQNITVSPNWAYSFNERTRISANYSYSDVEYKNPGDTRFVNYTLNSAQTSLTRVINEQTTASVTLSRTQSDTDNNVKSTNTNLRGGASYQFSETLSVSLSVGIRRTETDFLQPSLIAPPRKESSSKLGSTFDASLTKTFLRGKIDLSASRNISSDFNGQPIEVTRLSSTGLYRFNKTLSASLVLNLYRSKSDSDFSSSLNRDSYQIGPRFTWAWKKFWSLSGSYRYRRQAFDDARDDATGNAAYLTLAYRWPKIATSR